jgi:hypothetical protein
MEDDVALGHELRFLDAGFKRRAGFVDRIYFSCRASLRREGRRARLDDEAELDELERPPEAEFRSRMPVEDIPIEKVPLVHREHSRSVLGPDVDHSFADEDLHSLTQGIAAHPELVGKLTFHRQNTVGPEAALHDTAADRIDDLGMQIGSN